MLLSPSPPIFQMDSGPCTSPTLTRVKENCSEVKINLLLIVLQASKTAIPLRSDPTLAAVGGVFGTLSVEVSEMWILESDIPRVWAAT